MNIFEIIYFIFQKGNYPMINNQPYKFSAQNRQFAQNGRDGMIQGKISDHLNRIPSGNSRPPISPHENLPLQDGMITTIMKPNHKRIPSGNSTPVTSWLL